ncbi:MAG TPA: AMP-binding protein [Rhizomicrobium sp.]
MTPETEDLCRLLLARVQTHGDHVIYQLLDERSGELTALTYGELDRRARAVAAGLVAEGLERARLVLWLPTGFEFLAAFFGVLYAGGVCAPLALSFSAHALPRLNAILADLRPAAVLTTRSFRGLAQAGRRRSSLMAAQRLVCVEDLEAMDAPTSPPVTGSESRIAVLQYTSGSTSAPKGVQVSHANMLANAAAICGVLGDTSADRLLTWLPLFHDMGLVGGVMTPLVAAIPTILMSPASFVRHPIQWLEALSRHRATLSVAPNFAYALCCDRVTEAEADLLDLSALRIAFCGAEPVRAATMARFQARFGPRGLRPEALTPCYGLAEATLLVSAGPAKRPPRVVEVDAPTLAMGRYAPAGGATARSSLVSSGRPHPDQQLRIVDPVLGVERSEGEVGEIWISGPSIAAGYFGQTEASEAIFGARLAGKADPTFLRTGDLGLMLQGELYVTGRLKDLMIVRGANHYPQDLEETATASHPALAGALAAAFPLSGEDEDQVALIAEVPRGLAEAPAQLAAAIRREVTAAHGLGLAAVALASPGGLPRTSSGKIQRRETRERFEADKLDLVGVFWTSRETEPSATATAAMIDTPAKALPRDAALETPHSHARPTLSTPYTPPVTEMERAISGIVAEVLSLDRVGLDDDFFELGGDSLRGMRVASELRERLRIDLLLQVLFESPTVRGLAAQISAPEWEEIEI